MTKIAIIIGSTRQGRQTDKLAPWVNNTLSKHADVEVVDLRDYPLPFFDEMVPPRYNPERKPTADVKKWLDKVTEFDGYVVLTPEYNRALPAVLKNALDTLGYEADKKPFAIIAHGSTGGAQAAATLRITLPGAGAFTIPQALFFSDHLGESLSEDGELSQEKKANPYGPQSQLESQMESLVWFAEKLAA